MNLKKRRRENMAVIGVKCAAPSSHGLQPKSGTFMQMNSRFTSVSNQSTL
jgi:hypothetical protein